MKPSNLIDRITAIFQDSTVTYNESSVTYNDANTHYGGSDRNVSIGPQNYSAILIKPQNTKVE